MSEETVKKGNKTLIIVIIVAAALIIAGLVTVIVLLLGREDAAPVNPIENNMSDGKIKYEQGIIAIDKDTLQNAFNEALEKTKDGYITLSFNNWAESEDGKNFKCYLGNSEENKYDLYFDMYKDSSLSERILLTGLIPPGSGIDTFESEIDLDPGTYEAVLVLTQVKDDHTTILSQTSVEIDLIVRG